MVIKATRRVKLYSKYRPVRRSPKNTGYREVPWLNVSGRWLEQAGFRIGDPVEITVKDNELIITNKAGHGDQDH